MIHYIVEIEPGCWLAPWSGDPGRTTRMDSAKVFGDESKAKAALARMARDNTHRTLTRARVVKVTVTVQAADESDAAERCRVELVAALHLPPDTTWEEALARVVPVPAEVPAEPTAKGCNGCRSSSGLVCLAMSSSAVRAWTSDRLQPDLMSPKPGAPECPGRVQKEQG